MKLKLFVIDKAWQKGCVGKGENVQHITIDNIGLYD